MSEPQKIFDRYLPLKSFQGGMGVVQLCADFAERRAVALKTFRPELLSRADAREAFIREASVWIQIGAHPHVVAAHQVRRDGDRVYVIADFIAAAEGVSGSSLRHWIEGPLAPAQALDFALGIARGMLWASYRAQGLVHRDLKPENVLVGRDRRARVTDFGLAVIRGQDADGVCGTPAYMAPEQWSGYADQRSDIYAFGLILLEMLTGKTGISGARMADFAEAQRTGAAAAHAARAELPPAVRPLVEGSIAVDPARRPPDWSVVEQALLQIWPHLSSGPPPVLPEPEAASHQQRVLDAWSHNAIANALFDLGYLRDAEESFNRTLQLARDLGDEKVEAAALGNLGNVRVAKSDLDGAMQALEASLAIKRRLGDRLGEANSLATRGNAWSRSKRPTEALADYEEAARIHTELGRTRDAAAVRTNSVRVLTALGRNVEAFVVAKDAAELFRAAGDRRGEGAALGSMGQILRNGGQHERALECSNQALECFRSVADRLGEARELSFQGHTYRAMNKMVDAIDRYQESAKLAEELGDQLLIGSVYFVLAQVTPPVPQFKNLGTRNAEIAANAYRKAGRPDLAADADELLRRFAEVVS